MISPENQALRDLMAVINRDDGTKAATFPSDVEAARAAEEYFVTLRQCLCELIAATFDGDCERIVDGVFRGDLLRAATEAAGQVRAMHADQIQIVAERALLRRGTGGGPDRGEV
jgi:hypothetical protein